jgi:SMC interacting uncharacterized protein involved in chromosome segregation
MIDMLNVLRKMMNAQNDSIKTKYKQEQNSSLEVKNIINELKNLLAVFKNRLIKQ